MTRSEKFKRVSDTASIRNDLKRRSVLGAFFTATGSVIDFVLKMFSILILARLLIPEHFGLIGMVTALTGIAEQFSSLGLSTATIQTVDITDKQCSNLFWINVAAGLIFGMLICALSPFVSAFYQDPRLMAITIAISVNFLSGGMTVQHEALLKRQIKQPQVMGNRLIANFISSCIAIILALNGFDQWALVWREVSRSLLVAIGVWLLCPWIPAFPTRNANIGNLVRFGRDLTLTNILGAIVFRLDSMLIGKFSGPIVLGLYRQAYNLMMTPVDQLYSPILSVSQPGLSMLQIDPERYRRYYKKILFVVSFATVPLGIFSSIYAEEIILVILGQKWIGAVVFLKIFGIVASIKPAVGTSGIVLITCGRSGRYLILMIVHSVVMAISMAIGIHWGAVGVAYAQVSTTVLLLLPNLYYGFDESPVSIGGFFRVVSRPVIGCFVMAVGLFLLRNTTTMDGGILSLITGCGAAFAIYLTSIVLLPGGWSQLSSVFYDFQGAFLRFSASNET